jgi:hypothetical protein
MKQTQLSLHSVAECKETITMTPLLELAIYPATNFSKPLSALRQEERKFNVPPVLAERQGKGLSEF